MLKILVADQIAEQGVKRLGEAKGVEADVRVGLAAGELAAVVGDYDGMIVRSGVKVTKEVLSNPGRLRVIARAGVGVDNVDLDAATAAGILVMNTPDANTISTAEHTLALMLALFRRIPQAHEHVTTGSWDRRAFIGHQVAGKVLGVVGLGRVGRAVSERALSMQMKVLAYDPFLRSGTVMDGRVTVVKEIDDLLPLIDCLTLHATLTEDTKNLINASRLEKLKKTAVLINCARGGLVDDQALADALNSERIAGAAIDVFPTEPPKDSPLLSCKNAVLTPHLGASTAEAQTAVSTDAVDAMLDYLCDGTIRNAVNVTDLPSDLSPRDRAYLDLTGRMAAILSVWCSDGVDRVEVTEARREGLSAIGPTLALQAVVEMMNPHFQGRLNLVNAAAFAQQRGIDIQHATHSATQDFHEVVKVRFERRNEFHEIEGAVFADDRPRVLAIDGYRMEMVPDGQLVMIFNDDRPGVIGLVGTLFGNHELNIADLFLSRQEKTALMVLKSDDSVSEAVLEELRQASPILSVRTVKLSSLHVR
ncbi:MAG: phosphoglycerate dehydrogenase [Phycisphaerales bacterium]|nr:phosphoglycerate dehydrogenase [Phycisphaerales bacterium]